MEKSGKSPGISVPPLETLPLFVVLFVIGISAADVFARDTTWVFLSLTIFSALLSSAEFLQKFRWHFLFFSAICAGTFYALGTISPGFNFTELFKFDGVEGRLTGTFRGEYRTGKSNSFSFKMVDATFEFDDQLVKIPATIDCRVKNADFLPEPEQKYSCHGRFSIKQVAQNPVFKGTSLRPESGNSKLHRFAGKLQQKIRTGLKASLPPRHAAIITGFILGDTSGIFLEDRQLFKETGVSHLLAVSGQHLMILVTLLAAIFHWLKIPPISRSMLTVAILAMYAMTTSGSPSIWRALTMYLCISAVLHTEAAPSPIRPIAIAALIILLRDPQTFANAAFQLSFAAVLGIIYLRHPLEKVFKKLYFPQTLSRYLAAALAANIATIPMTALLFGTVSLVALLVNPMILWLFGYMLPAAFLIVFLSIVAPATTVFIAPALSLSIDGLLAFLQKAACLPGHFFYVGNLSGITIASFFALLVHIVSLVNKREAEMLPATGKVKKITKPAPETGVALRYPKCDNNIRPTTLAVKEKTKLTLPDYRLNNPFRNAQFVRGVDAILNSMKRKPIKSSENSNCELLPASLLNIENQNLYHQLTDLDCKSLKIEPERLIQAHIYLLALVGSEIINRVSYHLTPPPQPGDIKIEYAVRDRYLAISVLSDALLNSQLLTRTGSENFMLIISRAQSIYGRARNQSRESSTILQVKLLSSISRCATCSAGAGNLLNSIRKPDANNKMN